MEFFRTWSGGASWLDALLYDGSAMPMSSRLERDHLLPRLDGRGTVTDERLGAQPN